MNNSFAKKNVGGDYKLSILDKKEIEKILKNYPSSRKESAVVPLLHYVQKKSGGWLPVPEIERVGEILDMPYMRVYEIASFYTMFNLNPVGKNLLQVCKTTPCWLRGSDQVEKCIKDNLKISNGQTTVDGLFTLIEVECLGACVNAPILQINDDYFEDLDYETTKIILNKYKKNKKPKVGSVIGRNSSEPIKQRDKN